MKPPDRWADPSETPEHRALRDHRRELNRQLRATFLAGAEERSIKERGRGLTEGELRRVMLAYPGDVPVDRGPDSP